MKDFEIKSLSNFNVSNWRLEYERYVDRVPKVEVAILKGHTDEVLHVTFSHDGMQIASCSRVNML